VTQQIAILTCCWNLFGDEGRPGAIDPLRLCRENVIVRSKSINPVTSSLTMRSQFATASKRKVRFLPYEFTEHGAIMEANVLNSPKAIEMSVFVVRAFIKMRETLANNKTLALKLAELEKKLTGRLNIHERAIVHVLGEIRKLMASAEPSPEPQKRKIGFEVKEKVVRYRVNRKKTVH
jgi:phage regulator Rha-like protein